MVRAYCGGWPMMAVRLVVISKQVPLPLVHFHYYYFDLYSVKSFPDMMICVHIVSQIQKEMHAYDTCSSPLFVLIISAFLRLSLWLTPMFLTFPSSIFLMFPTSMFTTSMFLTPMFPTLMLI